MSFLRNRLGFGQRVVIVIALGVALTLAGHFITSLGGRSGWYAYSPLTASVYPRPGLLPGWARLLIWLGLLAAWTGASLYLLRARPAPGDG